MANSKWTYTLGTEMVTLMRRKDKMITYTYFLSKDLARVKADHDSLALTLCQKTKLESRQIMTVLHLHTVKRLSWSQGRSRQSCTYILLKD